MKKRKAFLGGLCAGALAVTTVFQTGGFTAHAEDIYSGSVQRAEEEELLIDDNSFDLDDVLADRLNQAVTVKLAVSMTGVGQTVLPAQVKTFLGWQKGFMGWSEDEEKVQTLGNNLDGAFFTFEEGSETEVRSIQFKLKDGGLVIPEGAQVTFKNCSFSATIVNNGSAVFEDCTFLNGKIENNGQAEYTGSTQEPENTAEAESPEGGELIIRDSNPYDLDRVLEEQLGGNDVVKLAYSMAGIGQTVLPAQVRLFTGWQEKNIFYEEGEKVRTLGNEIAGDTFTFAEGSSPVVKSIQFSLEEKGLVIPPGAVVTFENCSFRNTIQNNGTALFKNCVFENGKIENNGSAEYLGSTQEPENIGESGDLWIPLGLTLGETEWKDASVGAAYEREIPYELSGTDKESASIQVRVEPADAGIQAQVLDGKLRLTGTPLKAGTVTVAVSARNAEETTGEQEIHLTVNEKIGVSLEGSLDCVTAGQTQYQDYITVYVKEGDKEQVDYFDYERENPDAELEVKMTPEGSGLRAYYLYDQIVVAGDAQKAGTYTITAVLKDKGQTVESNEVQLRVYTGEETLKEQFSLLDGTADTWDMEPYEIWTSDHAQVPVFLKTVYGSRESGLYGIIGNNKSVGTDTLVIPEGCQVTFENIKFYSSVEIIVEAGASLTLSDSVAYGAVTVNGGTFSMKNSAALVDTLTLNEGSVLQDAEIVSNGRFLTDGSGKKDAPTVVIVNGKVTARGENVIEAECGSGDLPGQTALQVNGELVIPQGSVLTAIGGGDENYAPGWIGGAGICLNGGTISGEGSLIARGGVGVDGPGGNGIEGEGKITTAELESAGGDSIQVVSGREKGGDAVGEKILVTTLQPILTGGSGEPDGTAAITLRADKNALRELLEETEQLNQSQYTQESWTLLEKAKNEAKSVLEDKEAVQAEVDAAADALGRAVDQLEEKQNQEPVEKPDTNQEPETETEKSEPSETPQTGQKDQQAPELVKLVYSPSKAKVSKKKKVTLIASEPVKKPGKGWKEVKGFGGTRWSKVYTCAKQEQVNLTDYAGNTSKAYKIKVKNIDRKKPKAKITYSRKGQKVTVTLKTNTKCRTPKGWKAVHGKKKVFTKTYTKNGKEKVALKSLSGVRGKALVRITGLSR